MGTARRAQPSLRMRPASVPPLPPTLDVEGADQPAWWKIVAAHASIGRRARWWSIAAEGYNDGHPAATACPWHGVMDSAEGGRRGRGAAGRRRRWSQGAAGIRRRGRRRRSVSPGGTIRDLVPPHGRTSGSSRPTASNVPCGGTNGSWLARNEEARRPLTQHSHGAGRSDESRSSSGVAPVGCPAGRDTPRSRGAGHAQVQRGGTRPRRGM